MVIARSLVRRGVTLSGWRMGILVFIASLIVRALTAMAIHQPGFTDAYYYYHVAQNLYAGRGFVEDFIWNYLDSPTTVTHAANTFWGPLASLVVLPSFWLFGPSFRAAQLPMVLLGALLPVVAYYTARHLLESVRRGIIAAVLTIFSGVYFVYWTVPDGYVPFSIAGSIALLAMSHILTSTSSRSICAWSVVTGASIAFAQLARTDGVLLLLVFLGLWFVYLIRRSRLPRARATVVLWQPFLAIAAYALVMAPWLLRNWVDLGSPLANTGVKTLFLRDYNDVFTWGARLDLAYLLSSGTGSIVASKLLGAAKNLNVVAEALSYYLVPFAAIGLWSLRRQTRALPFMLYGAILYLAMTVAFTLPGQFGSLLHSLASLLPFLMTAVALGLDVTIDALVRFRPHLSLLTARRALGVTLLAAQAILTVGFGVLEAKSWGNRYSYPLYPSAIAWLSPLLGTHEPVMILDPPAYTYFSGRPAVVVPNNDPATMLSVARRYGVRYIILEPAHTNPLNALYQGEETLPDLALRLDLRNDQGQELKIYEID